jgi:hypothetical protein
MFQKQFLKWLKLEAAVTFHLQWQSFLAKTIDIERRKNRLLKFCYVPATSAAHNRLLFFLFLLRPFTVLMKQTRQAVCTVKQSVFLDVYDWYPIQAVLLQNTFYRKNLTRSKY